MNITAPDSTTSNALKNLIGELGLAPSLGDSGFRITGADSPRVSTLRMASANAVAMLAAGAGVAAIWRERTGRSQQLSVEVERALHAAHSIYYLAQGGMRRNPSVDSVLHEYFRTADDRWIWIVAGHHRGHHLDAALDVLKAQHNPKSVAEHVAKWNALELEDAMASARVPCGFARTDTEWAQHPQGQWLADRPLIEITKIADSPPQPLPALPSRQSDRALAGVRVLDAAHIIAGPCAARCFAEHGADVMRITPPQFPDPVHAILDTTIGKRSAWMDMTQPGERDAMTALVKGTDVMVESWRPGSLDKFGFSAEQSAQLRPGLIYVSVSAYGDGGPWGRRGGFDQVAQGVTGMAINEALDGKPRLAKTGTVADYITGYLAAAGAYAALLRRMREGGSWHVKVTLAGAVMWLQKFGRLPFTDADLRAPYADSVEPELAEMASPYGRLRYLVPPTRFSETPARFDRPPEPQGAADARWN